MTSMRELYQEVIIDHSRRPRNFCVGSEANHIKEGFNPLCGDKLTIYLTEHDKVIEAASFQGNGCAISLASASLMTEAIKGKTLHEVDELFTAFHHLITTGQGTDVNNPPDLKKIGKLSVLAGVSEFPARIKCATLAWHTLKAAIQDSQEPVSTETTEAEEINPAENPIIFFTEAAAEHIKKSIASNSSNIGFRLAIKKSGCTGFAYMPDIISEMHSGDIYFLAEQGLPVYVDPQCVEAVKGTVLDFIDKGAWQKQLVFNNPNVKDQCGCGESFSVNKPTLEKQAEEKN